MNGNGLESPTVDAVVEPHAGSNVLVRYGHLVAIGLVVTGFVLRLSGLSTYWLNPDEGIYYSTLTHASFGEFWSEVMANAHPPAYYLLLRGMGFLTWDFVWLRAVSLLFGTLAIWVFWLIGRELAGKGMAGTVAGLTAAGLLAVNPEAIVLSQVLRPYMMLLALLAIALLSLLRYRARPTTASLGAYVGFTVLAMLTHYSAALAFGVFCVLVAYDRFATGMDRTAWRRLAVAQAVPAVVLLTLYVVHLGPALHSDVVGEALDPGGWLNEWLPDSPAAVWRGFLAFQAFQLPGPLRVSSAVLLVAAIVTAVVGGGRPVAVLAVTAFAGAVLASVLRLYPFGPSRHDTWLVLFTVPALGWLAGTVATSARRTAFAGFGAIAAVVALGGFAQRGVGITDDRTNATEERTIRQEDLAPVVVQRLDPQGQPDLIVMTEQTYDVLMPLYPVERETKQFDAPSLFAFQYGSRTVVVARQWDWSRLSDVKQVLGSLPSHLPGLGPELPDTLLLTAGGWGSGLFLDLPALRSSGAILADGWAFGHQIDGRQYVRLMAAVVNTRTLMALP